MIYIDKISKKCKKNSDEKPLVRIKVRFNRDEHEKESNNLFYLFFLLFRLLLHLCSKLQIQGKKLADVNNNHNF